MLLFTITFDPPYAVINEVCEYIHNDVTLPVKYMFDVPARNEVDVAEIVTVVAVPL